VHDISHNHAFGHSYLLANKLLGIFANLPTGLPIFASFKKYHVNHHRYLGYDEIDPDIPSYFETNLFKTTFTKMIWVFLQPFFYISRPLLLNPKHPTFLELINFSTQLATNYLVGVYLGWHIVAYMIFSTLICCGLHPVAGHFISEHY